MESLKALNAARLSETNAKTKRALLSVEDSLRAAIVAFCTYHTEENLTWLNCEWALACRVYATRTPSGPDSPVGGAVEYRERKAA